MDFTSTQAQVEGHYPEHAERTTDPDLIREGIYDLTYPELAARTVRDWRRNTKQYQSPFDGGCIHGVAGGIIIKGHLRALNCDDCRRM